MYTNELALPAADSAIYFMWRFNDTKPADLE